MCLNFFYLECFLLPVWASIFLVIPDVALANDDFLDETSVEEMVKKLEKWKIIPECFSIQPRHEFLIRYTRDVYIKFGTEVDPAPDMTWLRFNMIWNAQENIYYTAMLVGLDEPSVQTPVHREYLYWLVTNIPICKILNGHVIAEYQQPKPENNTGLHRYVYIVYRQPCGEMIYREKHIDKRDIEPRYNFSNRKFADKYGYAGPYAVNFFTAKFSPPHQD
nr:PREDICTED: protein D2-like isoform X1 [Bemisia tabaci]XP_018902372.1 PREDICTED: protein D2-like isoform X1 [Bemisia tabaci]